MTKSKFGKIPSGERLERIKTSPNYKNGQFNDLNHTPQFAKNQSIAKIVYEKLFKKHPKLKPVEGIPSIKTDLHHLDPKKNLLIWFGHSSYFIQLDGVSILVDPVFSGSASPVPNTIKSFDGSNEYTADDLPQIDYMLITHDHYDHLDYETSLALKSKVGTVICGLGVGSHLEYWGGTTLRKLLKKTGTKI